MSYFVHRERLPRLFKKCPVSFVLIGLVTLVYLIDTILDGELFKRGALVPALIKVFGQYERLFLSMFLHSGLMHFLSNTLFGLAILGMGLEKMIGSIKYAIVYLVSGIGASLLIYFINLMNVPFANPFSATIGASGAIYGVMGVFLYIVIFRKDLIWESDRQYLMGLFVINLIFTFVFPNISILGHVGGFVIGFILGFFLFLDGNKERREHRKLQREWKKVRREYGE